MRDLHNTITIRIEFRHPPINYASGKIRTDESSTQWVIDFIDDRILYRYRLEHLHGTGY